MPYPLKRVRVAGFRRGLTRNWTSTTWIPAKMGVTPSEPPQWCIWPIYFFGSVRTFHQEVRQSFILLSAISPHVKMIHRTKSPFVSDIGYLHLPFRTSSLGLLCTRNALRLAQAVVEYHHHPVGLSLKKRITACGWRWRLQRDGSEGRHELPRDLCTGQSGEKDE